MKTKFTWFGIIAIVILGISTFFVGCKDEGLNDVITYHGQVVYINTTTPFPELTVKVTDGHNTHCQTQTDAGGLFSLKVRISEINNDYYLLAGDSTCVPKKVQLSGFGQAEVDLGVIEVEGPALPTVRTDKELSSLTADAAVLGGEVLTDGRLPVTARGICYGKENYPAIDGLHTVDGTGLGTFTSNLKDLEYNTIYYARAYATNKLGTAYGEQVKFTTAEGVAIVVTDSVIRITANSAKCKGHVESDGGFPVTKRGTCWSKSPDPTVDDDCTDDGSGKGEFTSTMKGLVENTTYYVRTYATNSTATSYGEQIIITTLDGLAVVQTDSISAITATGFTVYGTVVSDCDIPVTTRGFCYSTSQYPTIEDESTTKFTTAGKGLGSFHSTINGLDYATTYYVRAYATNETGTVYGKEFEIKTLIGLPTVTTDSVSNIGSVKATCGGNVTDDGTLTVTARGVCYSTKPQPTIEDTHTTDGKGTGKFVSNLKNLQDKTTYYVRAYATTAAGTAYGEQRKFKTENGTPIVLLSQLGEPTANSITCKGNVTGDGGVTITERGFCYGLTQYPTNTDVHVAIGNGTGEFSGSLTGLTVNTTYYIRAYAVNSIGVGYSEQKSFTTKSGLPIVTTTAVTTATATTIKVGGNVTDNGGYAVTDRGICYSVSNSDPTITEDKVSGGKGNGEFSVTITGLSANTTYHLRAYATNENGTVYGKSVAVQTQDGSASVTLGTITYVTASTASASVKVTNVGSASLLSCGICWSTNPNPSIENSKVVADGKQLNTAYTCNMSGLTANQKYYVRAYATTDATTTYSEQQTFTTQDGLALVSLNQIYNITAQTASGKVTVTDTGGATLQSCGICWSTNPDPTIEDSKVVADGKQLNTIYTCNMSGLTANQKYYVRAYATTDVTTAYSEQTTFMTISGLASISTGTVTTTSNSITCAGEVIDDCGYSVTERGICYSTSNAEPTITDAKISGGSGKGTFSVTISELTPATAYFVRAYATNAYGTNYGEAKAITTKNGEAKVVLESIDNITALNAIGKIMVTDAGGATLQSCGICWSTNPNPTVSDSKTLAGGKQLNTAYTCNMSDLTPNQTYHVRAYATTDVTTAYSEQTTFMTTTGLPVLATASTTATSTKINSGGNITNDGGYGITARGVCYSTSNSEPTVNDTHTSNGTGIGAFNVIITNVSISTTYYVRAYATNSIGTGYGEVVDVTTGNGLPLVTTTTASINGGTAISGGNVISDEGYAITARGICYGTLPNPDLSSAYNHTSNGVGTGYFTSSFDLPHGSGKYYIRAYATNSNGTTYGEQITIIQPYDELPTFMHNGHIYKVAPDPLGDDEFYSYQDANSYCESLTLYGYSDWRMPTYEELASMYANRSTIEGFSSYSRVYYWSSTWADNYESCHRWICFYNGDSNTYCTSSGDSGNYQHYYYIHVRPIRVEQ